MSTTTEVFADVDRMDAKAFASHLAEDCLLRFGNADEVVGRDAIEEAIAGFFTTIKGISHHIVEEWDVDDATISQLEATYTRRDDRKVTLPAVAIWRRGGELDRRLSDLRRSRPGLRVTEMARRRPSLQERRDSLERARAFRHDVERGLLTVEQAEEAQ